jgi:hypothetical protein
MKIKIENLTALVHGFELTTYQKGDALQEFKNLKDCVSRLEQLNVEQSFHDKIKDIDRRIA